jgi:HAE1 family hydrophobic/amphiphilic exporter-1
LDKSGGEYADLDKVTQQFIGKLMERPEIEFAQTSFNTNILNIK